MRIAAFLLAWLMAMPALAEAPAIGRLVPMTGPAIGMSLTKPALPRVYAPTPAPASPAMLCRQAIRLTERQFAIPEHLMAAIARVESGRVDAQGGVHPWPWTINAEGIGHFYETKADAIAGVKALQAKGVKSIDVGCMQVNLMFHPEAFASLDQAFDPLANARYAAGFLLRLKDQYAGAWPKATAAYHSATPDLGNEYERRVAAVWPEEKIKQAAIPAGGAGNMWSQNVWTANAWNTQGSPLAATGGGQMLNNHAAQAQIIPMTGVGRGLAAYRSSPIPVVSLRPVANAVPKMPPG